MTCLANSLFKVYNNLSLRETGPEVYNRKNKEKEHRWTQRFTFSVADPGFPVGVCAPVRGCGPPMWALFSENVCENKRIGSHRGWRPPGTPHPPPPPHPPMLFSVQTIPGNKVDDQTTFMV